MMAKILALSVRFVLTFHLQNNRELTIMWLITFYEICLLGKQNDPTDS